SRALVPTIDISRAAMERQGNSRLVDALAAVPSITFARPDGGNAAGPSLVALRGPDPSETLVALDGQILNDGNTGDLDIGRFPVAAFSNVSVTEGLGPSDTESSNTIGGAVNIISLRPTTTPHYAMSLSAASFGRSEGWINATGTRGRLGYAAAIDDQQDGGYVAQNALLCDAQTSDPCTSTQPIHLGSAVSSRTALGNITWTFSPAADIGLRVFALANTRDESANYNAPVDPASQGPGSLFVGAGPSNIAQIIRAYALHGRAPLGAGSLIYDGEVSDNGITLVGSGISPYDVTHRDTRSNIGLSWERANANSEFAVGGYTRHESLDEDGVAGSQQQSIQSYFARASVEPFDRLRMQGAVFASHYSTFGSSLDGRFGFSYDLAPGSVLRASVGTGFRAPLLIERYVFPVDQLPQDANCVALGQGNPNERPEHATEYELGYARRFDPNTTIDVALYRTNLRDPIENFYPLGASCPATNPPAQSFPINVGNVIYQGTEIRFTHRSSHVLLDARYGLNVAYPYSLPLTIANPTSGGNLVANQQFLNIPQQQAALGVSYDRNDWHAQAQTYFRGKNNELNAGAFAVLDAAVGKRFGNVDFTLAGSNLTNAVAGKFTLPGLGVPYRGLVTLPDGSTGFGNLPTDARFLEPAGIRAIVTFRT
ncbi:MAG: TonB-dependent receptor, partial [Candidatus Eremiobacteraeota bacterium]|nr:TonB-dependent receptor [Candidatus Eremiobacteraeota bacterium]